MNLGLRALSLASKAIFFPDFVPGALDRTVQSLVAGSVHRPRNQGISGTSRKRLNRRNDPREDHGVSTIATRTHDRSAVDEVRVGCGGLIQVDLSSIASLAVDPAIFLFRQCLLRGPRFSSQVGLFFRQSEELSSGCDCLHAHDRRHD